MKRSACAGLTLIEVLVSTVVLGLVVVSAGWALSGASSSQQAHAEEPIDAALVAKEIYELALRQDTASNGSAPARDAAGVSGLDSLDGARFSPPLDATLQTLAIADPQRWQQDVDLQVYDMSDLETPTSQAFTGAAESSSTLFRLIVRVSFRGEDMGTWWWWLNP